MTLLISLLLTAQMTLDVLRIELSLGPGLSLKNIMLYVVAGFIAVRLVLRRDARFELPGLQLTFILLIGYAILTWTIIVTLLDYQGYDPLENAMGIKGGLADYYLFFLVCFYGLRTVREAQTTLFVLMLVASAANLLSLLESSGLTDLNLIQVRDDGRVQGALGESNQYAAFLTFMIPMLVAFCYTSTSWKRWLWGFCAVVTALSLMITVSRGGFVGFIAAAVFGAVVFRRHLALHRIIGWGFASLAALIAMMFALDKGFRTLVLERIVRGEMKSDPGGITSGRTDVWTTALQTMLEKPVTFLTGYGWNAYFSMPFTGAPHNTYLNYWFNLGLFGVAALMIMFGAVIGKAAHAADTVQHPRRYWYMALATGTVGVAVAIFFVELYQPWIYIWATFGIVMRLALLEEPAMKTAPQMDAPVQEIPESVAGKRRDTYGWQARPGAISASSPRR